MLTLTVAIAAAYHNCLHGAFVFDDQSTILENASIRHLWPLSDVLNPPPDAGICGRPFANLTIALNYAINGLDPRGYRAVNLAIHFLASLTLFGVVRRTLLLPRLRMRFERDAAGLALAAAALWAVHPLTTIVVDYVSQRVEGLMALFYLLTLYAFIRVGSVAPPPDSGRVTVGAAFRRDVRPGPQETVASVLSHAPTSRRKAAPTGLSTPPESLVLNASLARGWSVLAVVACFLGMASKEVMVTAPVMIFLYDRTFVGGTFLEAWRQRGRLHLALAATWIPLAWFMSNAQLAHRGIGFALGVSSLDYALNECRAVLIYLKLAWWPRPLVFDYGWDFLANAHAAIPYVLGIGGLLLLTVLALWRRPILGFAAAWFFVVLAPSSSVVPLIQQPIAESRAYLSLAAVTTFAVAGLYFLGGRRGLWAVGAMTIGFIVVTARRNVDYRDEISLWSDTVSKRPDNARGHGNLGAALLRAGRDADAIVQLEVALKLHPVYPEVRNNLGAAFARGGRWPEAMGQYRVALTENPDFADAYSNLGEALLQQGELAEAIANFQRAARLLPDHANVQNNLGVALLQAGRVSEAISADEAAIRAEPNFAEAYYNLGNALARTGRATEAMERFETALRLKPDFWKAHNNLGVLLLQSGRSAEAIAHFEAALRLNPGYAEAERNLFSARSRALQ